MATTHPAALAMVDQSRSALAELVDVAREMLAGYEGDETRAAMVVTAYAACQSNAAGMAALGALQLAKDAIAAEAVPAVLRRDQVAVCKCTHARQYHRLTEKKPRVHKACGVSDAAGVCPCKQYTEVA